MDVLAGQKRKTAERTGIGEGMILHILLTILKWIGIVILCVLGLVLLLILMVLFVPVRYRLRGDMHEELHVRGSISWLLHILHASLRYDGNKPVIKLRLFGISLSLGSGRKQTRSRQSRKQKGTDNAGSRADDEHAENAEEKSEEEAHAGNETDNAEAAHTESKTSAEAVHAESETDSTEAEEQQTKALTEKKPEENELPQLQRSGSGENASDKEDGLFAKLKSFFRFLYTIPQKIRALLQAVRQAYQSAKDKVSFICSRISHMWNWWQHPDTGQAVTHVKKELRYLWRHLKPRKYAVSLVVGTGDPASTGELLGALGIVYAWTEGRLQATPDFMEKRLEADFDIKGRIFVYQLLGIAIRLFLDEHIRGSAGKFKE